MPVLMIRHQVPGEGVEEVVSAIDTAFAALQAQQPEGLRYAYYRWAEGNEFVALEVLDNSVEIPPGIGSA